jgi:hypothetical protein
MLALAVYVNVLRKKLHSSTREDREGSKSKLRYHCIEQTR